MIIRARLLCLSLVLSACSGAEDAPPDSAVDATVDAADGRCPLAVNEVAAAGDPSDWFELVNVSAGPVDLSRFVFIDELDDPSQGAALPATVLAPGGRHVQEVTDATSGFALGSSDSLWLYRVGTTVHCDGTSWRNGDSPSGGSWSRIPDGTGAFEVTTPDTRGVRNR